MYNSIDKGLSMKAWETRLNVLYMKHRTGEYNWKLTKDRTGVGTGPIPMCKKNTKQTIRDHHTGKTFCMLKTG